MSIADLFINLATRLSGVLTNINAKLTAKGATEADTLFDVPEKIEGISTGVDTSDGDAVASEIFKDKIAYVDGKKVVGTMADNGTTLTKTVTENGGVTIPEGYHRAGELTVDVFSPDLSVVTATAANVLTGSSFVNSSGAKVDGTMKNNGAVSKTLTTNTSYTIPAGYHNGSGKVIANVPVSLDTSDATATAARILSPYTAYVKGNKITGTIATKTSSDLTTSGSTVYVPAGYYSSQASKSISSGSLSSPSISVSSSGVITATSGVSSSGYLSTSASNSNTKSLTTQSSKTWTPTTSNQTISSGTYLTGTQTIKGDSNLVASNIKSGVSIFGVSGSYTGDGSGDASTTTQIFDGEITANREQSVVLQGLPSGSGITTDSIKNIYMTVKRNSAMQSGDLISFAYDKSQSLYLFVSAASGTYVGNSAGSRFMSFDKASGYTYITFSTSEFYFTGTYYVYIIY